MKDKEQSSKGSVDNLKTLKNRKERKGKGDHGTCRLSSSPKKAGHGGEHGYKGGPARGWRGLGWHGARP
jgi:hypothetical protein